MMKFRFYGLLLALLLLAVATESCTSTRETAKPAKSQETQEKEPEIRPSWYIESNRAEADTLHSSGYGMAVSMDSATSVNRATEQAGIRLKNAVGDSLEKIRRNVLKSSAEGSMLENPSFIIKLRNATADIQEQSRLQNVEVKRKGERWIAFVRAELSWERINQHLEDVLTDYPAFLEAI